MVERVGAMQVDGTARRIFHGPHGEREGAAREGRGCERCERRPVRVLLWPVLDWRRLHSPARLCAVRLVVYVSAPCRWTALHVASSMGHTESVKALLEKRADVDAKNVHKCAFSCLLYLMGDGCTRRLGFAAFRLVVERVGTMQVDCAARRIFHGPHGEREGAAREGRGR